jgi:hypothetical protein
VTDNLLDPDNLDTNQSYYDQLVGDGKKFKDQEALAKSKIEADNMIKSVLREKDELRSDFLRERQDNQSKAQLQDLIDQYRNLKQPNTFEDHIPKIKEEREPGLKLEDLETFFEKKFQEKESRVKEVDNFNLVKQALVDRHGSNYSSAIKEQIDDLGLSVDEFNAMARKQPKVLLRTLGLDQQITRNPFQSPHRSSQRSDSFSPRGEPTRSWSYYQKMRKDSPETYHQPKVQLQMMKDAVDLGERFNDGDFYS